MRSNTLRPALAAGLSIAAIGFAAATLSDAVVGPAPAAPGLAADSFDSPLSVEVIIAGMLLVMALFAVAIYTRGQRGVADKRWIVRLLPIFVGLMILVVVGNHLLFSLTDLTINVDSEAKRTAERALTVGTDYDPSKDSALTPGGAVNLFAMPALFGVLVLSVGALVVAEFGPDRDADEGEDRDAIDDSAAPSTIGRTAGDAADRIEDAADPGNEIYRAWRTMAAQVGVADPQTSTPAEFADAAIEEGLDPEHVAALTGLFEAVRYGHREVTEERERRAIERLRAIEREHADEE